MALTLDPQTEQRIQRLVERGHYESAGQIINLALDPFEPVEEWLQRNKETLNEGLEESYAQSRRGECHTLEEVRLRLLLAEDHTARAMRKTLKSGATSAFHGEKLRQNLVNPKNCLEIANSFISLG